MTKDLYFIDPIAKALQQPDPEQALRNVFGEIKSRWEDERYAKGFKNFERFMQEVHNQYRIMAIDSIHELIILANTGMTEESIKERNFLLNLINSYPEWMAEYKAFYGTEGRDDLARLSPIIQVIGDKGFVSELTFAKVPGCEFIGDVLPGSYEIKLVNTGWIIWKGKLTEHDLVAFLMAAKTEDLHQKPTKEIDLLKNGDIFLRTYPGKQSGRIEIELTG